MIALCFSLTLGEAVGISRRDPPLPEGQDAANTMRPQATPWP
jgi:hypothetical protein